MPPDPALSDRRRPVCGRAGQPGYRSGRYGGAAAGHLPLHLPPRKDLQHEHHGRRSVQRQTSSAVDAREADLWRAEECNV